MPDDRIKISALPSALSLDNTDVLAIVQGMTGDSKETKKVAVTLIAAHLLEVMQHNNLDTSDKTIIGAINEVAETLEGLYPVANASGPVANFSTELARPLEALKVGIVASQESGTPTPSSPKAINGWNQISLLKCGKNILENALESQTLNGTTVTVNADKSITISGTPSVQTRFLIAGDTFLKVKSPCIFSRGTIPTGIRFYCTRVSGGNTTYPTLTDGYNMATIGDEFSNLRLEVNTTFDGNNVTVYPMIEVGSAVSSYEKFNGTLRYISLDNTYYGGYVVQDEDGHRQFVVTHRISTFNDLNWSSSTWGSYTAYSATVSDAKSNSTSTLAGLLCEIYPEVTPSSMYSSNNDSICLNGTVLRLRDNTYSTFNEWKEAVKNNKIVYPLATPIVIDLPDGVPIETFIGVNNIFADSGDILECKYKDTIQHYIDTQIAATQALIL